MHAAFAFAATHPNLTRAWMAASNVVTVVTVADEVDLWHLLADAEDVPHAAFREPDLRDALTAIALLPTGPLKNHLTSLSLLKGREVRR